MKNINKFFTVAILLLTVVFAHAQSDKAQRTNGVQSQTIQVAGLCGMDKQRIEKAANTVDGVQSAVWNQSTQTLKISYSIFKKDAVDKVQKAVAAAGNDTEKYKASDMVYDKLPDCCHYRTRQS